MNSPNLIIYVLVGLIGYIAFVKQLCLLILPCIKKVAKKNKSKQNIYCIDG